ncbi:hypothetical protein WM07_01985 [Burkholderia ubonensis]|nr:hypothetical protein WM07_01985 [Burkholderia ubonensis]
MQSDFYFRILLVDFRSTLIPPDEPQPQARAAFAAVMPFLKGTGMDALSRIESLLAMALVCLFVFVGMPIRAARAADACPAAGPAACGEKSGLVPIHKDFIHASLMWSKKNSECPKMLIWMRPAEYKPRNYLNPAAASRASIRNTSRWYKAAFHLANSMKAAGRATAPISNGKTSRSSTCADFSH